MESLSLWYQKIARPLPWRQNNDPYRIWVSEIMLQQTQVETVLAYYDRFLKRFPTLQSLADSEEQEVLTLWSGLGYYRRAKNLRLGAQYLSQQGGQFPKNREDILKVPGIGPYTAGAILSIAFDLPEPLVDGNVNRVFARFFGVKETIQASKTQKFFWKMAEEWVRAAKSPKIHNQALMELGSLVCKKGTPLCHQCPLSTNCVANKKGLQLKLPVAKPRKETKEIHWVGLIFQKNSPQGIPLYFIKQNIATDWWEGLWDIPVIEKPKNLSWAKAEQLIERKFGRTCSPRPLNHAQHSVTHHKIHIAPFIVDTRKKIPFGKMGRWVSLSEISEIPVSALAKKIFRQLPMC